MDRKANNLVSSLFNLPVFKEYIDLRDISINNTTDLVKIAYTFRNPIYETFRIIYMCDNKIVGYESLTSRMPNMVNIFKYNSFLMNRQDINRFCVQMVNRMFRLGANGYYLMHNHPTGNAKASSPDKELTKKLAQSVKGFLGHVIIDHGTYAWISYEHGKIQANDNIPIQNMSQLKSQSECKGNPLLDQKISCRHDLARLMYDVKHSDNYSLLICCGTDNKIRLIQDIPNCFMNMKTDQIAGYIRNQAQLTGSPKAFISTTNIKVFTKACELKHQGALTDTIAYNTVNDVINLLAKDDSEVTQDILEKKRKKVNVSEKENFYENEEVTDDGLTKKELVKLVDTELAVLNNMDKAIEDSKNLAPVQRLVQNQNSIPVPDALTPLLDMIQERSKEDPTASFKFGNFRLEPILNQEEKAEETSKKIDKPSTRSPIDQDTIQKTIVDQINNTLKKYSEKNPNFPSFEVSGLLIKANKNTNDDTYEDEEE